MSKLPRVSEGVIDSLSKNLYDVSSEDGRIRYLLKKLKKRNKALALYVRGLLRTDYRQGAMGMLVMYGLLDSQAESDQMARDLTIGG